MRKLASVGLAPNAARLRLISCIFLGIEVRQPLRSAWIAFDLVWFLASRPRFAVKQNKAPVVYQRLPKHWSV